MWCLQIYYFILFFFQMKLSFLKLLSWKENIILYFNHTCLDLTLLKCNKKILFLLSLLLLKNVCTCLLWRHKNMQLIHPPVLLFFFFTVCFFCSLFCFYFTLIKHGNNSNNNNEVGCLYYYLTNLFLAIFNSFSLWVYYISFIHLFTANSLAHLYPRILLVVWSLRIIFHFTH